MRGQGHTLPMRAAVLLVLISLLTPPPAEAERRERVAVVPFNPVNVAETEAETLYRAFEAALIRTDAFFVIDREEVLSLLEERGSGVLGCTSAKCALELGRALAAGAVARGELVFDQGAYRLHLEMIDVSAERTSYLDHVSATSLKELSRLMEFAAFKAAGLTVSVGVRAELAQLFGELFVETVPSRADIYINGVKRGVSPDLISRVPLGRITVSAQHGNLYGEETLDITSASGRLTLQLREAYGALRLTADEKLDLYLDGRWLGKVGTGYFANLIPGIHTLELKAQGLYWRDEVIIHANRDTAVMPRVREYGSIEYRLPKGAAAAVTGPLFRQVVTGHGLLPAPAGAYRATAFGSDYETSGEIPITVRRDQTTAFAPRLQYTEEAEFQLFSRKIAEAERTAGYGYRLSSSDIRRLEELKQAIQSSSHASTRRLAPRVQALIERAGRAAETAPAGKQSEEIARTEEERELTALLARKQQLELQIETTEIERHRKNTGAWISFGIGLGAGGLAGLFAYLGSEAYHAYKTATYEQALELEKRVQLWDISTVAAAGAGGLSLAVASVLWISSPPVRPLVQELESVEERIRLLTGEKLQP